MRANSFAAARRTAMTAGPCSFFLSGEDAGTDADVVARHIRGMLAAGFAVRDGQGGTRPCRPEDFCILLRSRANFAQYEAALERAGRAAAADTGEDLLSQPEVGCVLSLLRVVDNPAQDIHMAAVMLSGMFGFSPDDLARLRLACPQGTLYAAVLQSGGEKEQRLAAVLRALRARAACAPLVRGVRGRIRPHGLARSGGRHGKTARSGAKTCAPSRPIWLRRTPAG